MNTVKTTGMLKRHFSPILMITIIGLLSFLTSCDDDDPGPDDNLTEAASAISYGFRIESPTSQIYYLGVYEDFVDELSVGDAVELGPNQRIWSFGEHPYTWSGDASTITKWNVDTIDLSLSRGETVSFASAGISGNLGEPVFFSEERAFFFALVEGKVAEFNPTEMTLTAIHDVDPIQFEGHANGAWLDSWIKYTAGDKILLPIGFIAGSEWILPEGAILAVFDPATNAVTYETDDRLQACQYWFALSDNNQLYVMPGYDLDAEVHYSGVANPLPTQNLLRLNNDGSFDNDWVFDMGAALGDPLAIYDVVTIANDNAVILWRDVEAWPADPAARWNEFDSQVRYSTVNLVSGVATEFTAFDAYQGVGIAKPIDGENYFIAFQAEGNTEYLLRQNSFNSYTEVTELKGGSIRTVARLW